MGVLLKIFVEQPPEHRRRRRYAVWMWLPTHN